MLALMMWDWILITGEYRINSYTQETFRAIWLNMIRNTEIISVTSRFLMIRDIISRDF